MKYLLDTNIISELSKQHPNEAILRWMMTADTDSTALSAVTLLEIRYGIETMDKGKRRKEIAAWFEQELMGEFYGRILPVDATVADLAARLLAPAKKFSRLEMDALIAATALVHGIAVVTMNHTDFKRLGVEVVTF